MTTEKHYHQLSLLLIVLLSLNALLGIYVAFFKQDAYSLEVLKAGGQQNMNMATQLYKSDAYVQQQRSTLEQILGSMDQNTQTTDTTAQDTTTSVTQ